MNVETLHDYISNFRSQVIESGFRRDVIDFNASLPNIQGNIVGLRDVAQNVYSVLEHIHAGDLPESLNRLFPNQKIKPFTANSYQDQLKALIDNKTVAQDAYFTQLRDILFNLNTDLDKNVAEVDRIAEFIKPYVQVHKRQLTATDKAVFSIIFKHKLTITQLKEFTKTLSAWNTVLPLYHQLVTNSSPAQIEILEVQNGSIDFVVNLDVKVALDLAELFKIGLIAYGSYLAQKKLLLPIAAGYFGNAKLKELDEEKEKVLLENIGEAVANKASEQHADCNPGSSGVDNPEKVVSMIRDLVTAHIVRGNDVKILALPEDSKAGEGSSISPIQKELSDASANARAALRELPEGSTTLLLKEYGEILPSDSGTEASDKHKVKKLQS
jgi:hypothetical protein